MTTRKGVETSNDGIIDDSEFRGAGKKLSKILRASVQLAQEGPAGTDPLKRLGQEEQDARMAWFREDKFGMYIHRRVCAEPGGF